MRVFSVPLLLSAVLALAAVAFGFGVAPASAHRAIDHRFHTCPSDHATYRWRDPRTGIRWLCVKPTADERNATFRKRIVWRGYVYWCKR
jgi:hypothetical protein